MRLSTDWLRAAPARRFCLPLGTGLTYLSIRWLLMLSIVAIVCGFVAARHLIASRALRAVAQEGHASAGSDAARPDSTTKPWGEIEYVPITLAPPIEYVPEYEPFASREVVWWFPDTGRSQLLIFLNSLGLSDPLRETLISLAERDEANHGFKIRPSQELVLGMSREDRAKLYVALNQFVQNRDQIKAFRFRGESLDEWLDGATLAPETRSLIEPLIYRHGGYLFFADLRSIETRLSSAEQRLLLVKALSRERTFLANLRITRNTDLDALKRYWSPPSPVRDIRPTLESQIGPDAEVSISIAYLLPPFARRRLYTYPAPSDSSTAVRRDCHWTAFNFFSETPDDRFCDAGLVVQTVTEDYYRVYGDLQFGDLVMFFTEPTQCIHSAVYLADDMVFTKNGSLSTRPWMLMKIEDLKGYYPTLNPIEIRFYRHKSGSQGPGVAANPEPPRQSQ